MYNTGDPNTMGIYSYCICVVVTTEIKWSVFHLCRPVLAFLCQWPAYNHQQSSKHSPLKRFVSVCFYDCVTLSEGLFQCYPSQTVAELSAAHSTHTKACYPMASRQRQVGHWNQLRGIKWALPIVDSWQRTMEPSQPPTLIYTTQIEWNN